MIDITNFLSMKTFAKLSTVLALAFSIVQPAFAAVCTLNGEEIPCDQMPKWFWAFPVVM